MNLRAIAATVLLAAAANLHVQRVLWLELGDKGRGHAPVILLPPPKSREHSEKYPKVLRHARRKKKGTTPTTSTTPGAACRELATRAAPPTGRTAASSPPPDPRGRLSASAACGRLRARSAQLLGARCPTKTPSARPRRRPTPRTAPGHRRKARPPGASAKRCCGERAAPAPGAAARRPAWVPPARSPRDCPSALAAGTTATRRRSRATSASACGGTANARSAA